jgi:hypothetical protein
MGGTGFAKVSAPAGRGEFIIVYMQKRILPPRHLHEDENSLKVGLAPPDNLR